MLPTMGIISAVKEKYGKACEHFGAYSEKHQGKVQALAVVGGMFALACAAVTGNASAAATPNANAIYGGLSIIDFVLIGIGALATTVSLVWLRDFRIMLVGVFMIVVGAVAFYMGL